MQAINITERAVLVQLNIKCWPATKHDKTISAEVAERANADATMGRYNKRLLAKECMATLKNIASRARAEHYRLTLPWSDSSGRILVNEAYETYLTKMRSFENEWQPTERAFLKDYSDYVEQAKKLLNGNFRQSDYPTIREVRAKFGFGFVINPVPVASDVRVNLSAEQVQSLKDEMVERGNNGVETAMGDIWARLSEIVSQTAEKLKAYEAPAVIGVGRVKNAFRDSIVTNITDLLDLVPMLNLTNDPDVIRFSTRIRKELTSFEPDDLRENPVIRRKVADRADDILEQMSAFAA